MSPASRLMLLLFMAADSSAVPRSLRAKWSAT